MLVRIDTRDGVQLDGSLARPRTATGPVDAWCMVHGTGGNFYQSSLFDFLAEKLLELGSAVLRINTRGHDGISTAVTSKGGRRLGAAYEVIDDCRHDLAGWIGWLRQNVGPRVGLLGHSMGALKCIYAVAHERDLAPACVVAVSPPHLSYSWFCESAEQERFLDHVRKAEQLVESGKPLELLEVTMPLPMIISAAGYLDKYGPAERYDCFRFIAGVDCPVLVLVGEKEVEKNVAFAQLPGRLGEIATRRANLAVRTVAGADHFYSGVRPEAWAQLQSWLTSNFSHVISVDKR